MNKKWLNPIKSMFIITLIILLLMISVISALKSKKKIRPISILPLYVLLLIIILYAMIRNNTDYFETSDEKIKNVIQKYHKRDFSKEELEQNERALAMDKLMDLACQMYHDGKPFRVKVSLEDRGTDEEQVYTFCHSVKKPELRKYTGPDWCFYWWKSVNIMNHYKLVEEMREAGKNEPKIRKAGWIGNINSPFPDVPEVKTRPLLISLSEKHPHLLECKHIGAHDIPNLSLYTPLPEQVKKYAFLIDIGGNGYSGRLKMMMWSGRPIIVVEREFVEYFHMDMVPFVHFIPVRNDLSDLVEKVQWCVDHPKECDIIGQNALNFAQNNFTIPVMLRKVYEVMMLCKKI